MLYWAYGSNLDPRQMRLRDPGAKRVGPLTLDGRLVFRNVADVVHDEDHRVAGGIWRITRQGERNLDQFEGVATGYYKKRYLRAKVKGVSEDVLFYKMGTKFGIMPPTETYFNTILAGYRYFELDERLLVEALHESWDDKKMTQALRERRHRKGYPRLQRRRRLIAATA